MDIQLLKDLIELAEDGYALHVKNASHNEFLMEDREILRKAKQYLKNFIPNESKTVNRNEQAKQVCLDCGELEDIYMDGLCYGCYQDEHGM
jgi:hypothetical protein